MAFRRGSARKSEKKSLDQISRGTPFIVITGGATAFGIHKLEFRELLFIRAVLDGVGKGDATATEFLSDAEALIDIQSSPFRSTEQLIHRESLTLAVEIIRERVHHFLESQIGA